MLHAHCMRCNKPLSDPESMAKGYGPDCWTLMDGHTQLTLELEVVSVMATVTDGYAGQRGEFGSVSVVKVVGGVQSPLANAAPEKSEDFEWGYGGSGPAALAKSMLVDCVGKIGNAAALYQDFKVQFVAGFGDSWEVSADTIREWVQRQTTATGNDGKRH